MKNRITIFALALITAASFTVNPINARAAETTDTAAFTTETSKEEGAADGVSNTDATEELEPDTNEDSDIKEPSDDTLTEEDTADVEIGETDSDEEEPEEKAKKEKKEEKKSSEKKNEKKEEKTEKKSKKNYSSADVKLLACLIYTEAGNQSYKGKLAVGNVVVNRIKSSAFPNTMKKVIYQPYQFGVCGNHRLAEALNSYSRHWGVGDSVFNSCVKAAKQALEGNSATGTSYYFFCRYSTSLAKNRPNGVKIGAHYFYK